MSTSQILADLPGQQAEFGRDLIKHGWLIPTLAKGINGLSEQAEDVIAGINVRTAHIARTLEHPASLQSLRFPPVTGQDLLRRTNYLTSFPQLIGGIETFDGGDAEHRALRHSVNSDDEWRQHLSASDMVLVPAVCHALYPHLQNTIADGECYELTGDCFRNEPSDDPFRMVSFRMREYVLLGTSWQAVEHRNRWLAVAEDLLGKLGLAVNVVGASDPFFGRPGRLLAQGQRAAELKFELLVEAFAGQQIAVASGNWHQDHFGTEFSISTVDDAVAHSACFGFGLERIMLALVAKHGFQISEWPDVVRTELGL